MFESEPDLIRSNMEFLTQISLRRSGRVPHQSDRYLSFLIQDGDPVELDENDENLITYMDEMQRSDSDKWLEAMKFEIESMKVNDVWILVDPLKRLNP